MRPVPAPPRAAVTKRRRYLPVASHAPFPENRDSSKVLAALRTAVVASAAVVMEDVGVEEEEDEVLRAASFAAYSSTVESATIPVRDFWFRVYGLGFRVWGFGSKGIGVEGLRYMVYDLGFTVYDLGSKVQGSGFRVYQGLRV